MEEVRAVRDFKGGLKAFGKTLLVIVYMIIIFMIFGTDRNYYFTKN